MGSLAVGRVSFGSDSVWKPVMTGTMKPHFRAWIRVAARDAVPLRCR